LPAPGALDLRGELLKIAAEPLGSCQIGPAQAARDEIVTLVSHHTEKRVIGRENGAIEVSHDDPDDIAAEHPVVYAVEDALEIDRIPIWALC
jgi:hypothetical protein